MWVEPVTLEGRFVRLEPLVDLHAEDLAAAATPELFTYHFPPRELSADGFREQMRGLALTSMVPFALVERDSGRAVGMSAYMDIQEHHRTLEIGFTWIGRPWQGSAVNPESKLLLLRHAFDKLGAVRVQLKTDVRNLQSQRALAKLGAVREGVLRKHMLRPDGFQRDTVMYSIVADEWPGIRAGLEQRLASR